MLCLLRYTVQSAITALACCAVLSATPLELSVSPTGKYKTIESARDALREAQTKGQIPAEGAVVTIQKGVYLVENALVFDERDSGASAKAPVRWCAAAGAQVILRGSRPVDVWKPVTDKAVLARLADSARSHIRVADLRAAGITDYGAIAQRGSPGLELFYQDKRQPLARFPNEGWLRIASVPQAGEKCFNEGHPFEKRYDGIPTGRHYGRYVYAEDRPSKWAPDDQIYVYGYWTWDWSDSYQRVKSIDTAKREVTLAEPHHNYGYTRNQRYYFLNVLEELDRPGEWYLDRGRGLLYFYPPKPLAAGDVSVSMLEQPVIAVDGAANLVFEGLVIEQSRSNGISIKGGSNVRVYGCTLRNLGGGAVVIQGGARHGIMSCDLYDLAHGGVIVDGGDRTTLTPSGHEVVNNHIHHFSQWLSTGECGIECTGVGNRVAHNLMHDTPFQGLRLKGNDHLVEFNEFCHLTKETGDAGATYAGRDYTWRGNVFRYNYFHDMKGPGLHGATSFYLDDFASGFVLYGNIFYKAARAVQIGGGRDNLVENNLFIECSPTIHLDARGLGWAEKFFNGENNWLFDHIAALNASKPPYATRYPELRVIEADQPAVPKGNRIISNISWGGRWADLYDFYAYDFHKEVEMRENIIGDALFVRRRAQPEKTWDPYYMNIDSQDGYQLARSDDPAIQKEFDGNIFTTTPPGTFDPVTLKFNPRDPKQLRQIGFKPIPVEKIGLQKDAWRKTIPMDQR